MTAVVVYMGLSVLSVEITKNLYFLHADLFHSLFRVNCSLQITTELWFPVAMNNKDDIVYIVSNVMYETQLL